MTRPSRRSSLPGGFTLMELIVVVVVLSLVATMAWPSMRKLYTKGEIENAARQVRDALVRARLEAIETGTTQVFRFQPGTGRYEVVAKAEADGEDDSTVIVMDDSGLGDPLGSDADFTGDPSADLSALGDPLSDPLYAQPSGETLDHQIRFAGQDLDDEAMARTNAAEEGGLLETSLSAPTDQDLSESSLDTNPLLGADPLTGLEPIASLDGSSAAGEWSAPIVFHPNGRASNARIRLTNGGEYYVDISLRGLTGGARISKVQRWQETIEEELGGTRVDEEDATEFGILEEVPLEVVQ